MVKNYITILYFFIVGILCFFILISINFIIISDETLKKNLTKIILSRIAYTLIVNLLAIGLSYGLYLIIKKLTILETENKNVLKLLTAIFTTVSVISLSIFLLIISCSTDKNYDFKKVLTNENNVWIFYEGEYLNYKRQNFNTRYKFYEDGSYQDILTVKVFGSGKWEIKNDMLHINADSYRIVNFNNDSIVLQNVNNHQIRFYNIKSEIAKSMLRFRENKLNK